MKIHFNYQIFYQQKIGGITNYYNNLLKEFTNSNVDVTLNAPVNIFESFDKIKKKYGINLNNYPSSIKNLIEYLNFYFSEKYINKHQPDILHNSFYSNKIIKRKNTKNILTVYDMITELHYSKNQNYKNLSIQKRNSVLNSDHIICISENTKKDLINLFNVNKKKISVVYLGTNLNENGDKTLCKDKDFILYVGSRRDYKNFANFIKAYSISKKIRKELNLILFGGEKYSKYDAELIERYNLENKKIKFISGNNLLLQSYYMNAKLFVYPSLYEGFGLPILEAMANSCPVCCSRTTSIPEVAGVAAEYFDPRKPEEIAKKMEKVIFNKRISKKLISRGLIQSKKFSWKKCAKETIEVYKKIII